MRKYGCWDRVGSLKTKVVKLVVDLGYLVRVTKLSYLHRIAVIPLIQLENKGILVLLMTDVDKFKV